MLWNKTQLVRLSLGAPDPRHKAVTALTVQTISKDLTSRYSRFTAALSMHQDFLLQLFYCQESKWISDFEQVSVTQSTIIQLKRVVDD